MKTAVYISLLLFAAVPIGGGVRHDDLRSYTAQLDSLERRINVAESEEPARVLQLLQTRLANRARPRRFQEVSVEIDDARGRSALKQETPSISDTSSQEAPLRLSDNEWRETAEAAVAHERDSTQSFQRQISNLEEQLAESDRKSAGLEHELVQTAQQQQERFVDQVRKEERLRAEQEQFMARKFTDLAMQSERKLTSLHTEAAANMTAVEQQLVLEKQRLRNATAFAATAQQQSRAWGDAAKRSMEMGKGKADALEELAEAKLQFHAATRVAGAWRKDALQVLRAFAAEAADGKGLDSDAGDSPDSFNAAFEGATREKAEAAAKVVAAAAVEKKKHAVMDSYNYPAWDLEDLSNHIGPGAAYHDAASKILHAPLPPTSVSDMVTSRRNKRGGK